MILRKTRIFNNAKSIIIFFFLVENIIGDVVNNTFFLNIILKNYYFLKYNKTKHGFIRFCSKVLD